MLALLALLLLLKRRACWVRNRNSTRLHLEAAKVLVQRYLGTITNTKVWVPQKEVGLRQEVTCAVANHALYDNETLIDLFIMSVIVVRVESVENCARVGHAGRKFGQ